MRCSPKVGLRDASLVAVGFYGVRRISEILALQIEDLTFNTGDVNILVKRQKNDPYGRGHSCTIPKIPELGVLCPYRLLKEWTKEWPRKWGGLKEAPPVFYNIQDEESPPGGISADYIRKLLQDSFQREGVGTHSLRKGGCCWMRFDLGLDEETIQAQGGWASRECMQQAYTVLSRDQQRLRLLAGVAAKFSTTVENADRTTAIPNVTPKKRGRPPKSKTKPVA